MKTANAPARPESKAKNKTPRLIGWQGFTLNVPETFDLTGFSGTHEAGYFRVDDSEEQGVEIKWATEPKKAKKAPDVDARLQSYFKALHQAARRKKLKIETREADAPRRAIREERTALGFTWTGDRRAIGAIWYCRVCHRVVIAQMIGELGGPRSLGGVAEAVLSSLNCHSEDPAWQTWALYDLCTEVPSEYALAGQQLMNVYLRLSFAHKSARLSVEQWALANVARRDAYLDTWLAMNTKAEMGQARYKAEEGEAQGHPALLLSGGVKLGRPAGELVQQVTRLQKPATRFSGVAWECEPSNKLYLVEGFRPRSAPDVAREVAKRTRCHGFDTVE